MLFSPAISFLLCQCFCVYNVHIVSDTGGLILFCLGFWFLHMVWPWTRARVCKRLRSPGIDSEESIPPAYVAWRPDTTNRVIVPGRQATKAGGVDSSESIPGLLTRLKIRGMRADLAPSQQVVGVFFYLRQIGKIFCSVWPLPEYWWIVRNKTEDKSHSHRGSPHNHSRASKQS